MSTKEKAAHSSDWSLKAAGWASNASWELHQDALICCVCVFLRVTFSIHGTTEHGRQMWDWDSLVGLPWGKVRLNTESRSSQTGNWLMGAHHRYCCPVYSNAEAGGRLRAAAMKGNGGRALGGGRGWRLMEAVCDPHTWLGLSYWGATLSPFPRPRILTTRPLLLHSARKEGQHIPCWCWHPQNFLYKWDIRLFHKTCFFCWPYQSPWRTICQSCACSRD